MIFEFQVTAQGQYADITGRLRRAVADSGVKEGLAVVQVPHTSAGLGITSFWDPRGMVDLFHEWERSFPARMSYRQEDSPVSAAAHGKSAVGGASVTLMVHEGKLLLGSSQGVCLMEYDGPRPRRVVLYVEETPLVLSSWGLTTRHMGMHDITRELQEAVRGSGIRRGICHVSMPHSTAGLAVGRPSDARLIWDCLERLVPTRADFLHDETPWDAAGHVKTVFTGSQQTFAVQDGEAVVGGDLALFFTEFDGPRKRKYLIGVYGEPGNPLAGM